MGLGGELVGRVHERHTIAAVSGARNGVGGALVLRGDPGVADHALDRALAHAATRSRADSQA